MAALVVQQPLRSQMPWHRAVLVHARGHAASIFTSVPDSLIHGLSGPVRGSSGLGSTGERGWSCRGAKPENLVSSFPVPVIFSLLFLWSSGEDEAAVIDRIEQRIVS